jgi:hypothetical protein
LKRAAKANHRKAVAAGKRKLELVEGSLAAQVTRAVQTPIQHCLLTRRLFKSGIGTLIIARGATSYNLAVGVFLIDSLSLGVKDTFFRTMGAEAFDDMLATMEETCPINDVDPAYAHKLLRDVTAWAASHGFAPHRDFAALEKLFGDVDADACDATFEFGDEGRVAYISGPGESRAQIAHRLKVAGEALEKQEAAEI